MPAGTNFAMKQVTQIQNRFEAVAIFCLVCLIIPFHPCAWGQEELPDPLQVPPFQYPDKKVPEVDLNRANWLQASNLQTNNEIIRSNWVMLGEGGDLKGRIESGIDDSIPLDVFALNRGFIVGQTQTDSQGFFRIEGLRQGAYTFVGYNPNRFVTFGLNLVDFRKDNPNMPNSIVTRAVNFRDKHPICKLIQESAPSVEFRIPEAYPIPQTDIDQAAHFGWIGLAEFAVAAIPATTVDSQLIRLGQDGLLRGRIHQIDHRTGRPLGVSQTKVMLVEQGEIVVETTCNRNGEFEFVGMPSGEFGLVAFGKDGFAALGVQLLQSHPEPTRHSATDSTEDVAAEHGPQTDMSLIDLCLIQTESTGWINHFLHQSAYTEALAQPRPKKGHSGPCCVHCQKIIISGTNCDCHAWVNDNAHSRSASRTR